MTAGVAFTTGWASVRYRPLSVSPQYTRPLVANRISGSSSAPCQPNGVWAIHSTL